MKYAKMIKSMTGAALVMGSVNVMASGSHGGWYHDSNTGTFVSASAPSYASIPSKTGIMSKKGSGFGNGVTQDSNTGTLMNARVPVYEKQNRHTSHKQQITLNSFGGGAYQDMTTGTLTRID